MIAARSSKNDCSLIANQISKFKPQVKERMAAADDLDIYALHCITSFPNLEKTALM